MIMETMKERSNATTTVQKIHSPRIHKRRNDLRNDDRNSTLLLHNQRRRKRADRRRRRPRKILKSYMSVVKSNNVVLPTIWQLPWKSITKPYNTTIEAQSFYNLLNLCDGLNERGIHIGTPKRETTSTTNEEEEKAVTVRVVNVETRQRYAFELKARMDTLQLALNETAYTALIRLLAKSKHLDEAQQLLDEAETISQCKPRLRLYSALLIAYCDLGNMTQALRLWQRLVVSHNLTLTEREYAAFLKCANQTGNATIMERVLSDLAEDVLMPSRDTTQCIIDWFVSPHATTITTKTTPVVQKQKQQQQQQQHDDHDDVQLPVSDAPSMGPVQVQDSTWIVSYGCKVDTSTGTLISGCLQGERLQPVSLSKETWKKMLQMNETIVLQGMLDTDTSAFQGGGKGPKQRLVGSSSSQRLIEQRQLCWKHFLNYLQYHQQKQQQKQKQQERERGEEQERGHTTTLLWDVVVDGANVGYYKQNFVNAPKHVDYHQIDWIVHHFRQQHQKVLLILHERHFSSQLVPSWAKPIVDSWSNTNNNNNNDINNNNEDDVDDCVYLYRTPFGMNDDWFWLHAALWSGSSTLVVTNDEMRDHHFQMLAPRFFLRWKERHQVHFEFGDWIEHGNHGGRHGRHRRQVLLTYPDNYSRRIQRVSNGGCGLVVPLAKRGDDHRYLDGTHIATTNDPQDETYLCIRPNK